MRLTPEDGERLRSWSIEIAASLLPDSAQRDEGHDRRFGDTGGLVIDKSRGCWWSYAAGRGGWSTIKLISLLKDGWSAAEVEKWALAWLANHPGTGSCTGGDVDDDGLGDGAASRARSEFAREILDNSIPIEGTPAADYLASRGVHGTYPDCVRYFPGARTGEGALVGVLQSHDRVVGIQLTYIDPMGRKSLVEPARRRFMLEKSPDAVFEIYSAPSGKVKDIRYDLIVAEGLEDGLSIAALQRPCRVIALPGVGTFRHVVVKKGDRVLVVCDGDDPESAAHKGLIAGLDSLLLQTDAIWRTETPAGEDANSILTREGVEALARLFDEAVKATLSIDGEAQKLARLDKVDYDRERRDAADRLGIRLGTLDGVVASKRERSGESEGTHSQADVLLEIALEAELFHAADGTGFADITIKNHRETWPIRGKGFRQWLARQYFAKVKGAPSSEAMQSSINVIEAQARWDGPEREVHIRVGGAEGKIYIDLGDPSWQAVEIDAEGWRMIPEPPVRFRRSAGMKPLPRPERGGNINALRKFINLQSDADFVLIVTWLLAALRPCGPYPVLGLAGEQGTAKSTLTAILRRLIDPNTAPLRALSREDRDLFIAATNAHLLAFDNVSGLPAWISDTLCRIATGGGFAVRQLYTDGDEVLFDAARPIVLNGIEDIITRPDLADRSLLTTLVAIERRNRRAEKELLAAFEKVRPLILGALLDGVSCGLRELPNTEMPELPRMADFALWGAACETAFWPKGTFWSAYGSNIEGAVKTVVDADAVATAVCDLMAEQHTAGEWTGTASQLLDVLTERVGKVQQTAREWPKSANALSGRLRRCTDGLRKLGITIVFGDREGHQRTGQ
jgi:hypothetical protein